MHLGLELLFGLLNSLGSIHSEVVHVLLDHGIESLLGDHAYHVERSGIGGKNVFKWIDRSIKIMHGKQTTSQNTFLGDREPGSKY